MLKLGNEDINIFSNVLYNHKLGNRVKSLSLINGVGMVKSKEAYGKGLLFITNPSLYIIYYVANTWKVTWNYSENK